jgi:hypothetical protein
MRFARIALPRFAMQHFIRRLAAITLAVSMALPGAAASSQPVATHSSSQRTISNTATIAWEVGATRFSQASNRVDLLIASASGPLRLTAYRLAAGGEEVSFAGTHCAAGTSPFLAAATLATAPVRPLNGPLRPPPKPRRASRWCCARSVQRPT